MRQRAASSRQQRSANRTDGDGNRMLLHWGGSMASNGRTRASDTRDDGRKKLSYTTLDSMQRTNVDFPDHFEKREKKRKNGHSMDEGATPDWHFPCFSFKKRFFNHPAWAADAPTLLQDARHPLVCYATQFCEEERIGVQKRHFPCLSFQKAFLFLSYRDGSQTLRLYCKAFTCLLRNAILGGGAV